MRGLHAGRRTMLPCGAPVRQASAAKTAAGRRCRRSAALVLLFWIVLAELFSAGLTGLTGGLTGMTGGLTGGTPLAPVPVEAAAAKTKVVVLDPGHGGAEKGACYYGMQEKILNLKIAKYCQAELNQYANVRVILTRTTDRAVASGGLTQDLKARCRIAKNNRADLFVCLHNNAYGSGESRKTNGARVYYQNNSFYSQVGAASHRLANLIVRRVAACGVANGGARTKYSDEKARRDQNGRKGDYYGVLFYNKKYKIPAVIVEHAFMSNAGDAAKLKKESFLKSLGRADAAAIAEYLGLKKKPVYGRKEWRWNWWSETRK